ncbi:MAG: beta-galactosidase, partial [Victivallales bacterium]|nr:beta-galactosidase [Victivallales bacterium]
EPSKAYVQNIIKFKKKITELKLLYNEVAYQLRDVFFLFENYKATAGEKFKMVSPVAEFQKLEQSAFELFSNFTKFRFNQFPFAVRRKDKLMKETDNLIAEFKAFSEKLKGMANEFGGEKKFTMPEKGEIDVKMSFADYDPCSWGGSPGYLEYENGRLLASLGIVGNCYYSYIGGRYGYDLITPEHLDYMENYRSVFAKYCKETGFTKCTSHELSTYMIPFELWKKFNKQDYVYDLEKETVRPATDRDFREFYSGNGIISEAIESKEFKEMIEYLAKYAADMPGVHARSISLEGMQIGGYSEYGFAKFREFLKERHGSIEGLNKTWGSSYKSFDEIKPLAKYQETREEYCNHFDWVEFRSRELLNFYKFLHDTYRKYDRSHPLTACFNQYSPLAAVEFYELNKYLDFAAAHNTPTYAAWYQIGLARRGQLADNNEPKWINFNAPWNNSSAEDELQKCQRWNMTYYAMQGMSQFAPYEWREGTVARFGEYDGYLNLSGVEFKEFTKWLGKWQGLMGAVAPKDCAKTALYWSFVTKSQSKTGFRGDKSGQSLFRSYFKLLDNWNSTLNELQIPFGMVTRGKIREDDLGDIRCIIVPQAAYLEPDIMEALLKFARDGGELVLEGSVGRFDQYRRVDERIFDAIGIVQLDARGGKLEDGTSVQSLMTVEGVGPEYMSFDMIAPEKVKVLAKYKDGRPAAVRTAYGKGQVTCVGFSLSGNTKSSVAKRYLGASLAMREFSSPLPSARLFPWEGRNGFRYVAVLNYSGDWTAIPVECAGKVAEAYDVETGVALNVKDGLRISVPLFPAGGRVIAVRFDDAKEGAR